MENFTMDKSRHSFAPPAGGRLHPCYAKSGQIWFTRYAGTVALFVDSVGFGYIWHLLQKPKTRAHVTELVMVVNREILEIHQDCYLDGADEMEEAAEYSEEILPPEVRTRIKNWSVDAEAKLKAAISAGDAARIAELRHDIQTVQAELKNNGFGRHAKAFPSRAERDRKSVSNAIARAIKTIAASNRPLALHLSNSIRTGYECAYLPEQPPEWQLQMPQLV
jgi:hypothetical protein